LSAIPGSTTKTNYRRISINNPRSTISKVEFYSKIYRSADDIVNMPSIGASWSVGNILGNDSGGVENVEVIHK
jgi:hypothetical protein